MTNEEAKKILKFMTIYSRNMGRQGEVEALDFAIEALEQQPCEDCISRAEAIRIASGYCAPQNIAKELRKLPPVTPQPKWIPISEKLPEDGTEIFVYLFNRPSPYIAWIEDTHWYTEDFEIERENEPVAWLPLPEPYVHGTNDGKMAESEEEE